MARQTLSTTPVSLVRPSPEFDTGSFRDRAARVFFHHGEVYRSLSPRAHSDWRQISSQPFFQRLIASGQVIGTRDLSPEETARIPAIESCAGILRHDRIPFVTYPYEWCFSMLRQAALLHLEILERAIPQGVILKDSSPYNVQFRGTRPVFIDVGSFALVAPGEPWAGYRQFCEMMLFPLLLQAYRRIDIQPILRVRMDGITAREFLRPLSWRDFFRGGVLTHGWLQSLLERSAQSSQTATIDALKTSGFDRSMIQKNVAQLAKLIRRIRWKPEATLWTGYRQDLPHVQRDLQAKASFVDDVCQTKRRKLVWDLGCNDGYFSRIAAGHAETVLAMDQDHGCVERLFRTLAAEESGSIVPLCIDLLNPSAALGWRGRERQRLESRGLPDLILCLGLIHHLVIGGNIPLPEVVDWLASLTGEVVLEFPSKSDPMVKALLRNKYDQYEDYSLPALEAALQNSGFRICRRIELPSGERTLLHAVQETISAGAV